MPPRSQAPQPQGYGLPFALLDGLAYSLEVGCRHDIGERRCRDMGGRLLLTLTVAFVLSQLTLHSLERSASRWMLPFEPDDVVNLHIRQSAPYHMIVLCLLIVVCHIKQRWRAARRRRRGETLGHSYYNGRPDLLRLWPRLDELYCKRIIEPALHFLVGALLVPCGLPQPGIYMMVAAVALHISVAQQAYRLRQQALDASDGVFDMMSHQEAVAAEWAQPEGNQRPAAATVQSPASPSAPVAPEPSRRPAAAPRPQPAPQTAAPPDHLRGGLNESLNQLLDEPNQEQ
jgi:hypothetical protein